MFGTPKGKVRTGGSDRKRLYIVRAGGSSQKVPMGKWCSLCGEKEVRCAVPGVHLPRDAEGLAVRQEMLFGMHEEECRVDAEQGREAGAFKWVGMMMESGAERERLRAEGRAAAVRLAGAREARIAKQLCEICMVGRGECDWPEVHFSRAACNVAHCNEVCWRVLGCWSVLECVGML